MLCGDDCWPCGENTVCWCWDNGVETGGVAAAGVRPCCDGAGFIAVGTAIAKRKGMSTDWGEVRVEQGRVKLSSDRSAGGRGSSRSLWQNIRGH